MYSVENERRTERPVRGQRRRVRPFERDVAQLLRPGTRNRDCFGVLS